MALGLHRQIEAIIKEFGPADLTGMQDGKGESRQSTSSGNSAIVYGN
jgi:hypothetical protein